jgi:hypothetical protein
LDFTWSSQKIAAELASIDVGGDSSYTWVEYAANFLTPPVFVETIIEGDVYEYTYSSGTLYRLVGATEDSFYSTFITPNLSGLVISRDLNI